jgi:2,4-dienoyl-CoA reductase-like NADH-dependent reductase (Old Yellow Enzyme family)
MFEPVTLGRHVLRNRIVMAPMTRGFATNGVPSKLTSEYYRRRAAGGVSLIITEGIAVSNSACHPAKCVPRLFELAAPIWRDVVNQVHGEGGFILAQLWDTGLLLSIGLEQDIREGMGPSGNYPVGGELSSISGRAMSKRDIAAAIEAFAQTAVDAQSIGFDGVELHGAHGYLIDQFFWNATNCREDDYGGDLAQRTRFCVELIAMIRSRVGPNFLIALRFSNWKLAGHYEAKLVRSAAELSEFLAPLTAAGIDMFDCSTRRYWEPAFAGSPLTLAGWTRRLAGKPTMAVGSVGLDGPLMATRRELASIANPTLDFSRLVKMIESAECDLVGVGRALIANPDWATKVKNGDFAELLAYSPEALSTLD